MLPKKTKIEIFVWQCKNYIVIISDNQISFCYHSENAPLNKIKVMLIIDRNPIIVLTNK